MGLAQVGKPGPGGHGQEQGRRWRVSVRATWPGVWQGTIGLEGEGSGKGEGAESHDKGHWVLRS